MNIQVDRLLQDLQMRSAANRAALATRQAQKRAYAAASAKATPPTEPRR